ELLSPDSLDRVLERLKREREDLARQIGILRQELDREAATSRNLKSLQIQELEDARLKSRNHLSDREKWERIAAAHLQTFQDLQQRIAAFEDTGSTMAGGRPDDVVSLGGFSDVSDLEGCENALDVFIGQAEVAVDVVERLQAAASAASQPPLSLDKIQTVVCVDLRGFDAGYSAVAAGLRPTYDSLVSFGPFGVDDSLLEHLSTGSLGVEVRASLPGSEEQFVLGRGLMPLAGLLRYAGQDTRNPAAGGVVTIRDPKDQALRYSIEELAEDFQHRAKLRQIDHHSVHRRGLDPNLGNVSGLPPAPRQRPDEPGPRGTGQGPALQGLTSDSQVRVDDAFCAWVESSGGLHFLVFDDASPQNRVPEGIQALGLVGEVKAAGDSHRAAFTLSRDLSLLSSGPAVGTLEAAQSWAVHATYAKCSRSATVGLRGECGGSELCVELAFDHLDTRGEGALRREVLSDFKLMFLREERGLRSLQRGWRTPDPSPIRKGLPKCAANIEFLVRTRKDKSEPSSHDEDEDFETRTPEWARIRTPSPDMRDNHYQPCLLPPVPPVYCFSVPGPPWSCLPCNSSSYGRVACGKVADGADLPTPGSSISLASMSTSEEGTEPLLSLGSLGHPDTCATGCKYMNNLRGCKDGSQCDHCHLCEWRRPLAQIRSIRSRRRN
ncbi:unnamed protein product, partial [Polarella glacialis]